MFSACEAAAFKIRAIACLALLILVAISACSAGSQRKGTTKPDSGVEIGKGGSAGEGQVTADAGAAGADCASTDNCNGSPDASVATKKCPDGTRIPITKECPVTADTDPDTEIPTHPVSKICGDGIRDPVTEECDDLGTSQTSSCTADCRVRAQPLPASAADSAPALGTGPHVAAGTDAGLAFTYEDQGSVWLQEFGASATAMASASPIEVSEGFEPLAESNSAIAALPDGRYAVAWTDGLGGTPDVRMRKLGGAERGAARLVQEDTAGFQQDPDMLWLGDRLLVAWTDLLNVKYRSFDAELRPLAEEQVLTGDIAIESSVVLSSFADGWAAAVRANEEGLESIHVIAGELRWSTPLTAPSASGARPALVELDDKHLLLLFSVAGVGADQGSNHDETQLRASVLSIDEPGAVSSFPIFADDSGGPLEHQIRPNAVRVGAISYVGWQTASAAGTRSFVAQVALAIGQMNDLSLGAKLELPIVPTPGTRANLHLAASSLFPGGALISLWESTGEASAATALTMDFRPSPFVFLPN